MDIRDRRGLKGFAADRLEQQSYSPRRLALIHAAAAALVLLTVTGINYMLGQEIETTTGLSGIGARSVLATIQSVLQYAVDLALPFWEIGFVFAAIGMARGTQTGPKDLLEGFRRFGPVLRLMILRGFLFGGLAMACLYFSSVVYAVTPFSAPLIEQMLPMMESGADMVQIQEQLLAMPMEQVTEIMGPMFVIFALVYGVVAVIMFYRFRMADYLIMDKQGTGAMAALVLSSRMTKKKRFQLFRLDLSFWWYYALQALAAVICYGDTLLSLLGVALPVSADGLFFISYAVGLGMQILLCWCAGSQVQTTWAAAYDELLQQPVEAPQPKPAPKNLPWDEYQ